MNPTKKTLLIAFLSAMATALMTFTQIPMFGGFMQLDFSVLPVLVSLYILDLKSSLSVLLLRSLLKLLFFSEGITTFIGMPMNIVAMCLFIVCIWCFQRKTHTFNFRKFVIGGVLGTLLSTGAMLVLNMIYALPLYEKLMNFNLKKIGMNTKEWIVAMVIPFNLIQGIALTISGTLLLMALLPVIRHLNHK